MIELQKEIFDCEVAKLIPYEFNNKSHPAEQINMICNSFTECWFLNPILIDENNIILAWHGRLEASRKLNLQTVPVIQYFGLSEPQKKKFRILDNRIWDFADYNLANLEIELRDINDEQLNELFKEFNLDLRDPIEYDESIEDEVPEINDEDVIVQLWDIFQLWDHTLICWDSRSTVTVETLMNWAKSKLIWTDPPYNVNYESNWKKIENDNMSPEEFERFMNDIFHIYYSIMEEWSPIYVAHSDTGWYTFRKAFIDAWFYFAECLIRNKDRFVLGRQDYHRKHEPILYWWKPWKKHSRYWERNKSTIIENNNQNFIQNIDDWVIISINWESFIVKWKIDSVDNLKSTIINYPKPNKSDIHPTMKPVGLIEQMIINSSKPGDIVVDLFNWSWSTLITCEKTWRVCKTIELMPKYTQASIKRFYDYTKGLREIKCLNRDLDINLITHGQK